MLKLQWNVYIHNFNGKSIETFNVFEHQRFYEDVCKDLKKSKDIDEFAAQLKGHLFYYFGSKCEYEVVITSWVPHIDKDELDRLNSEAQEFYNTHKHYPYSLYVSPEVAEKVDVYSQIMNNYDIFVGYIWSHKLKR